ncbi:hypothetical protein [Streptomyces sp. DH37]|uniref:hypothetical protein n=1 Tax=Streptomyces sp. DH37 TaxID=3040122 RepID=UPI002441F45F|nr:hypothetical protein [Streptomyces sp. DH37]MDG9701695.1 hypothetical protein [Streptomyces sp. DH37]
MSKACPGCGESSQVLDLPAFWKSLAPGAELKAELAQPPSYAPAWLPVLGLVVAGVWLLAAGSLLGLVALAAGAGAGWVAWTRFQEAEAAREAWARSLYCRKCPGVFLPEQAKVA